MADEIRQFSITVPANTLNTAPIAFPMTMPPRDVEGLQIIVPPGPSGLVGFAVLFSGVRIIPYLSDLWIITAGEIINWPLEHQPNAGSWSVLAYNTGSLDHVVRFRWLLRYLTSGNPAGRPDIIDVADVNAFAASDTALTIGGP